MTESLIPQASQRQVRQMLLELGVPIHRSGFRQLCAAVSLCAAAPGISITKELYPRIAKQFGQADWRNTEHTIRNAISAAWRNRTPAVWEAYFPHYDRCPTNKQFISMLAMRIDQ